MIITECYKTQVDGVLYSEAIDPNYFNRIYTETDELIIENRFE